VRRRGCQPCEADRVSWWPRLSRLQWITFALLAGLLAITNVYTTLLTGWGDSGSIIAVIATIAVIRVVAGTSIAIEQLNIGQTMASAGGAVGFATSAYAAFRLAAPEHEISIASLMFCVLGAGTLGVLLGTALRRSMVGFHFPSGTACAVIQRTLVHEPGQPPARAARILGRSALIAALVTIPAKITLRSGGPAVLPNLPLGVGGLNISPDPLLYGIGVIVGPQVGAGLVLGSLAAAWLVPDLLSGHGVAAADQGQWMLWFALAILTLPSLVSIAVAYRSRTAHHVPDGFATRQVQYPRPANAARGFAFLGVVGVVSVVVATVVGFELSPWTSGAGLLFAALLCVMNARVAADTDINPVLLVAVAICAVFGVVIAQQPGVTIGLLALIVCASALAAVAVDLLQDYRTGYLLDVDPAPQTTAHLVGVVIGVAVAVPFVVLLDRAVGFGDGGFAAPGPRIYAELALAVTAGPPVDGDLLRVAAMLCAAACGYALLGASRAIGRWLPSLFGIGLGLLLPVSMCAPIFIAAAVAWGMRRVVTQQTLVLVGSAILGTAALVSVLVILVAELLRYVGYEWFFLAL
jgi:uncharacterized oligopeptide transporter (OPT) family protein